jgi:3-dehydroquinate synthase
MRYDKKVQSGKIRFVLPRAIGQVFITDNVSPAIVEKVLGEMI